MLRRHSSVRTRSLGTSMRRNSHHRTSKSAEAPRKAPARVQPQSRAARREAARVRRNRTLLVASIATSGAVVGLWFPFSGLLNQRHQLASVNAQIQQLDHQDATLAQEEHALNQPSEVGRLAQEQYQLVNPGQTAYQVLPPASSKNGGSFSGDPAYQPLASPAGVTDLPAGQTGPAVNSGGQASSGANGSPSHDKGGSGGVGGQTGVWGRILQTLEFWR